MKRSKQRWFWFLLAILLSTGTYFTIRYGLRPKPIPVMNATQFDNLEEIGAVTYRRLRQEVHGERMVLLGSSPEIATYREVWNGFMKTAVADKIKVDVIFQADELVGLETVAGAEVIPFKVADVANGNFLAQVKDQLQQGHFIVIHAPTIATTHLMKDSLSMQLDVIAQHPVLALSTLPLSYLESDQEVYHELCAKEAPDDDYNKRVSCSQARLSKVLMKKFKNPPKRIWSIIERHGLKEYLIFVHN